jgi:hypothetical protein
MITGGDIDLAAGNERRQLIYNKTMIKKAANCFQMVRLSESKEIANSWKTERTDRRDDQNFLK